MYSISLEKAEPRSEERVHKEGDETVIKLVDKEDLRNGGIVGGDDRSVRVGDQEGVFQFWIAFLYYWAPIP